MHASSRVLYTKAKRGVTKRTVASMFVSYSTADGRRSRDVAVGAHNSFIAIRHIYIIILKNGLVH